MLPPDLLLSISPALLRDLVTTFATTKPSADPAALARSLFLSVPSKKLRTLLLTRIAPFSTRPGRAALLEAAAASSLPASFTAPLLALPHADVAPTLALDLERTTSPSRRRTLRRLFALASLRTARDLPERPTYELFASSLSAAPISLDPDQLLPVLRRALSTRLVDAWPAPDPDGSLRLALFLSRPPESRLTRPSRSKPSIAPHAETPIVADVLRVFPGGARVALTLAEPHLLPLYASALALSLAPSFTTRPLQTLTTADLAATARTTAGLASLDAVGLRRRLPSDRRIEYRGPGALDAADAGPRTGYIDRVTFRARTDDGADVDAFFQLPYRIEFSDPARAHLLRAAFDALGLFSPGALPDDARSLAPYEHGDWRWRAIYGDAAFERLLKSSRLVRVQAKHVATREHRMHGAGYIVRDVPGEPDLQYALAEDRALGARLVGPKDRVAYRLDTAALAAAMMRDLGAHPASAPLVLAGVLDLGVVTLASGKLRIVYVIAEPPAGWLEALRRAAGIGMTPAVLVPKGHAGDANGMLEIELAIGEQLGAERVGRVLGRIAEALGLEKEVEAWRLYDEEVVVETAKERAWISGVSIAFNEHRWRFVHYIAKKQGAVANAKDIGASISKSAYPDVVARRMKAQVERQVRRELEAAGVDTGIADRMIVGEGRQGYRFGVSVRVV